MTDSRYEGKPLLALLESYVLWCIGRLDEGKLKALNDMTPKLRSLFGHGGAWHEIIASQMHFPPSMPHTIREIWEKNEASFQSRGESPDPNEFAKVFVDENFA